MRLVLRVELCRDTTSFSSCFQGELYSYRLSACWNMCLCVADSKKSCLHVLYICTFLKMKYVPYVPYVTPSQLFVIQFLLSTCFLSFCRESYSMAALLWDLKCEFVLEQPPSSVHPDFAHHALLNNALSLTDLKKDLKLCRLSRRRSLPKLIRKTWQSPCVSWQRLHRALRASWRILPRLCALPKLLRHQQAHLLWAHWLLSLRQLASFQRLWKKWRNAFAKLLLVLCTSKMQRGLEMLLVFLEVVCNQRLKHPAPQIWQLQHQQQEMQCSLA